MNLGADREICEGDKLCATAGFDTYYWSPGVNCNCITPAISGTYSVAGTDEHGCSDADTVNIVVNPLPLLTFTKTDVTTTGAHNGTIDLTVSGGTPGYNYTWSNGAHTQDLNNLSEGWYTVEVKDTKNCVAKTGVSIGGPYNCAADSVGWAQLSYSTGSSCSGNDICTDNQGNVYVTGSIWGTIDFSGHVITTIGGFDIFLAKFTNSGKLLWVKSAGGLLSDNGEAIAVDQSGNVFISGCFKGTANFGGTQITALEGQDIFTAKYTASGDLLWVKSNGSIYDDYLGGIAINNMGECVITGTITGTAYFGIKSIMLIRKLHQKKKIVILAGINKNNSDEIIRFL